ncbi:MAG: response regulator, partial [Candidatus Accumulibacter phosphatis]|nr:response regulator [Candidatus Accumulibacter phosphatis]
LSDAPPAVNDAQAALPPGWPERQVLVVEDDAHARDALVSWLASWGCQVVACASAAAVRKALETIPAAPDALVTDWRLPGGEDGLDVVRLVRQRFRATLPAILITGDALDDARRLSREHGFVLLHKPVRPAALRVALGAHWLPVRVAETVAAPSPPRAGAPRRQEGAS